MGEMQDKPDSLLLRDYAEHGSETVFRENTEDEVGFLVFIEQLNESRVIKLQRTNGNLQYSDKSPALDLTGDH